MTTIADRIAGRDLDREAVADELDDVLEQLAVYANPSSILLPGEPDLEFLAKTLDTTEGDDAYDHSSFPFSSAVPMLGCANMGVRLDHDSGGSHVLVFHVRPATRDDIHLDTRCQRGSVPSRSFSVQMRGGGLLDAKSCPKMYHAFAGNELWSLTRGNGGPLRRGAGGRQLQWTASAALQADGTIVAWPSATIAPKPVLFSILRGVRSTMVRRFNWGVTIGHPGLLGSFVECSPEGARALFADRNVVGGKRRTALRHWVKEHYRRGHTADEAHVVREHLRGIERFTWHGLDVKLQVPTAELEAAGLLARGGR